MENLKRQFLDESKENLTELSESLQKAQTISDEFRRECLRTLHTIKGTSQTFGFIKAGFLAHVLESLFSESKNNKNVADVKTFIEGFGFLKNSLKQTDFEIPESFLDKIYSIIPKYSQKTDFSSELISQIPAELTKSLSNSEKNTLNEALKTGKNLFCVEAVFDLKNFAEKLKSFRQVLSEKGEVIATFPSPKTDLQNKIGFRFLFAASVKTEEIEEIAKSVSAEIIYRKLSKSFPEDLQEILSEITAHAKNIAEKSEKKIEFEISADKLKIPVEKLKTIFDITLHLVRNAVDHAIEIVEKRIESGKNESGKIEVFIKKIDENDLLLTIADDGNGIDLEKLKAKALEQNIISDDENLSEKATLELIFQSELSTASEITETSGRGVGLGAVKNAVEKSGGKISVESERGKGTRFEIFLPNIF